MAESISPFLEKMKVLTTLVATVAIPVIVVIVANLYSKEQKESELAVRYVELAVGILRAEPTEQSRSLRTWAVAIVNRYSQVPMTDELKRSLEINQLAFSEALRKMKEEHELRKKIIEGLQ